MKTWVVPMAILVLMSISPSATANDSDPDPKPAPCHRSEESTIDGFFLDHAAEAGTPVYFFSGELSAIEYDAYFPDAAEPLDRTLVIHGWIDCLQWTVDRIFECFEFALNEPADFTTCLDDGDGP